MCADDNLLIKILITSYGVSWNCLVRVLNRTIVCTVQCYTFRSGFVFEWTFFLIQMNFYLTNFGWCLQITTIHTQCSFRLYKFYVNRLWYLIKYNSREWVEKKCVLFGMKYWIRLRNCHKNVRLLLETKTKK